LSTTLTVSVQVPTEDNAFAQRAVRHSQFQALETRD